MSGIGGKNHAVRAQGQALVVGGQDGVWEAGGRGRVFEVDGEVVANRTRRRVEHRNDFEASFEEAVDLVLATVLVHDGDDVLGSCREGTTKPEPLGDLAIRIVGKPKVDAVLISERGQFANKGDRVRRFGEQRCRQLVG